MIKTLICYPPSSIILFWILFRHETMFFRFGSAVVLVILISLIGIMFEKRSLELRRDVSRQYYRLDVLEEAHARMRLVTQQLGTPERLIDAIEQGHIDLHPPEKSVDLERTPMPLLRWQRQRNGVRD